MTNLERYTNLNVMAELICKQNIDELADKSCRSMQAKNSGSCPHGDDGPNDFTDCIHCNKVWLLEEVVD